MEHTDFTFRKAWMIYTVYVLLLFPPPAKAQQTARLVSLEQKKFSFDDAELAEIMKSVGTWYNTSIIFHSADLLKQRIHFRFPRTTSLEEVVQALNDLGIAKLEQKKGKVIISDYSPKH